MVYDVESGPGCEAVMVDPADATRRKAFGAEHSCEELLVDVFAAGGLVYDVPSIEESRARAISGVDELDPTIKRFLNPHVYPVGLERGLNDLRTALVLEARGITVEEALPRPEAIARARGAEPKD
jgi:nicotinate phosphoribosyltransferase